MTLQFCQKGHEVGSKEKHLHSDEMVNKENGKRPAVDCRSFFERICPKTAKTNTQAFAGISHTRLGLLPLPLGRGDIIFRRKPLATI